MWKPTAIVGIGVLACVVASCGGYTTAPSPTPAPDPVQAPPSANAVVINVVAIAGAQSFSPNPSTVAAGQPVVWHNVDTIVHRVVLNDGEVDTGNLSPGALSAPMILVAPGPYHCAIHPEMVGTIKAP